MAIIGIDLGTTNSLAAYWKDGNVCFIPDEREEVLLPSVVSYRKETEEEGFLVGQAAKERLLAGDTESVGSFKRFMGTKKKYELGGKEYQAMELSAMVLKRIKQNVEDYIKEEIEEAIITVPAYFNDKQRSDTKKAAQIAGLKVERLINEPSAAALAYRLSYGKEDKSLLVFDFGGGTLDLSYVECFENVIEIVAVVGDNYLGGDDIDQAIAAEFCRENGLDFETLSPNLQAAILTSAEAGKRELSECGIPRTEETEKTGVWMLPKEEASGLQPVFLDEGKLFELCMPLFAKIKKLFLHLLEDADSRISDVDDLIMVGGSSKLSVVKRFLTELLGKEPIVLGDTDQVVAMGAGIYAGIRQRQEDIRDLLLTDVCPFTLGVEVFHREKEEKGQLFPIIERNSTLPATRTERLVTLSDYQSAVKVKIYQGEEYYAADNILLGDVSIEVEPKKAGKEWVDVTFTYDINGILHVGVENAKGKRNQILLANQQLSDRELQRYQKEMEELLVPPLQQESNRLLLEQAELYYGQSVGAKREWLGSLIDWFIWNLSKGRLHTAKKAADEMREQLARIEQSKEREEYERFDGELKWAELPEWEEEEE